MYKIKTFSGGFGISFSFLGISLLIQSCSYCPPSENTVCYLLDTTHLSSLVDSSQTTTFEDAGTIIVFNGFASAQSKTSGTQGILKVKGSIGLPVYVTNAAIFLNGWRLQYLDGDEHVAGITTLISRIRFNGALTGKEKSLQWQAVGAISDGDFDNPYRWWYYYTVVAWNDLNLALTIDQTDDSCNAPGFQNAKYYFGNNQGTTNSCALTPFASFLYNPDFIPQQTIAILPRGFGFAWGNCQGDNHFLQLADHFDHAERFVEKSKPYLKRNQKMSLAITDSSSLTDSGFVGWETFAIFKDNGNRKDYIFGEMVSGLAGNDLEVIEPPFGTFPVNGENTGTVSSNGVRTKRFAIRNLSFKYVVPIMSSWDLRYLGEDQHVKDAGIWVDSIRYGVDPLTQKGVLRYSFSSVLADDDNQPDFGSLHKVTLLGFKENTGITNRRQPDLVPISPHGAAPSAFCRIEDNGKILHVTVKNIGNADAGAFTTTVIYQRASVVLDVPQLPAGQSADLLFMFPSNCFNPDCSFKIIVDSENKIEESGEGNNSVIGGCIG